MTTRQVAEMLRLSTTTVRKRIKSLDIPAEKRGHYWKVRRAQLVDLIENTAIEFVNSNAR